MLGNSCTSAQDGGAALDEAEGVRWMHIAQRLLPAESRPRRTARLYDPAEQAETPVFVQVLERPTQTTLLVLWRGAARCHYGDQLWIRGIAKRDGVCALSGQPVARGNRVYYPRHGRGCLSNAFAMILATSIEREDAAMTRTE